MKKYYNVKTTGAFGGPKKGLKRYKQVEAVTENYTGNKPFKMFGIKFKKMSHYLWFLLSILILLTGLILSIINGNSLGLGLSGYFFMMASVNAILHTKFGKQETNLFSPDCIWFNGLMGGICYLIMLAFF